MLWCFVLQESKAAVGPRNICYLVAKEEKNWWPRLLKQAGRPPVFLKVDWDKWVDEDEEKDNKCWFIFLIFELLFSTFDTNCVCFTI